VTAWVVVGGCAGGIPAHEDAAEVRDRYAAYAGPPVDSFTWMGHYNGWEDLGRDRLVLFTSPNDAYLIRVWPSCALPPGIERIGFSTTANTVYARLDAVTFDSPGTGPMRCPIEEIRKVDYRAMQADLRAARAADKSNQR
jgi:Family of unknown function (DUF6491)